MAFVNLCHFKIFEAINFCVLIDAVSEDNRFSSSASLQRHSLMNYYVVSFFSSFLIDNIVS